MKRVVLALALAACGGTQKSSGRVEADDAIVKVQSNVRDAQVFVDGRYIAELHRLGGGVAIEPGAHRLELRHDEYFSSYLEVTVARAERKTVRLEMAPILP